MVAYHEKCLMMDDGSAKCGGQLLNSRFSIQTKDLAKEAVLSRITEVVAEDDGEKKTKKVKTGEY